MPGEEGVWLFIFGDMLFFAVFFVTFNYYRAHDVALYTRSQLQLNQALGLANTLILLTSSWCVVQSLRAFRSERIATSKYLLAGAGVLGMAFIVSKAIEWSDKFRHGITVETNEFFMFYFMFTGIHLIHVIIGLGVLAYLYRTVGARSSHAARLVTLEGGAAFWHLVDMLWVVLFALLYLMR
ncbi:cytochrome c oxidase subunit 3 [Sphingobium sp.]|uniref:cytochrome c oxidase subunit 3 n=1 Tax=Sphingobium sp. TaxID=1912891 RepID=UPI0028BF43A2|nr:cytochrome c oxidase subunit 3 [Sphingobium sp.]